MTYQPRGMQDIEWAGMPLPQFMSAFNVLVAVHADVMSRVRIGEGHDNRNLFALAADINKTMHEANDDLERRDNEMTGSAR